MPATTRRTFISVGNGRRSVTSSARESRRRRQPDVRYSKRKCSARIHRFTGRKRSGSRQSHRQARSVLAALLGVGPQKLTARCARHCAQRALKRCPFETNGNEHVVSLCVTWATQSSVPASTRYSVKRHLLDAMRALHERAAHRRPRVTPGFEEFPQVARREVHRSFGSAALTARTSV